MQACATLPFGETRRGLTVEHPARVPAAVTAVDVRK